MIADSLPAAVVHIDADLKFTYVNRTYRAWHGLKPAEVLGIHVEQVIGPESFEVVRPRMIAALAGENVTFEADLTYKRVGKLSVQVAYVPDVAADGDIVGFYSLAQDITDRRRAEEALAQSERRLKTIFNATPAITSITTLEEGRYLDVNEALLTRMGYSRDEMIGRTARDLDIWVNLDHRSTVIETIMRAGYIRGFETDFRTKNGETYPAIFSGVTIGIEGADCLLSITTDITERKQAEGEVVAAKHAAEQADRSKSEFLANMSHELRTPLNAILGFTDMVRHETFGPVGNTRYEGYLDDIHNSGSHLLSLINAVLDLSKIESGHGEIEESDFGIADTLEECVQMSGLRTADSGLTVEVAAAADLPALRADRRMVRQMLLNLLGNAVKFTEPGGRVTIACGLDGEGRMLLTVADTGIGIAEQDIPKAMSTFGQIEGSWERRYEGTGLGLPMVKSLAELHGGGLEIASDLGVGTTATIWFPKERVAASG